MTSAANLHGKNERMRSNIDVNLNTFVPKLKRLWPWLTAVALGLFLGGCATPTGRVKNTTKTFDTVVLDAGHGGYDDGASSRWGGKEKNHTLSVIQKLNPKLQAAGFKTVLTRRSDVFVELNERARISNRQDNAIFVSVHFNSSPRRKIRGTEVYYRSSVSQVIAQRILSKIAAIPGCSPRYTKTANFRVLKLNEYPAVLVECGYLSNRGEGSTCTSSKHHERLAQAIAEAIIEQRGPLKAAPKTKATPTPEATPAAPTPAATTPGTTPATPAPTASKKPVPEKLTSASAPATTKSTSTKSPEGKPAAVKSTSPKPVKEKPSPKQ